jgi:enoyl-CoA hydratase/carnithine racemase
MPETIIGFFPDVGAAYFYNQLGDQAEGMYLALTGKTFNRDHAIRNGIATHSIDQSQWDSVMGQLAAGEPLEMCVFKTAEAMPCALSNDIQTVFAKDTLSELIATAPTNIFNELRTKSPLSIAVTHAYMQRVRGLSLAEVLEQDFALAMNFVRHGEFKEGIRALLIDKDKTPQWHFPWPNDKEMPFIPIDVINDMFDYTANTLFPINEDPL